MKRKTSLKRKLIAAERFLHSEGFITESERSNIWKRFDKAFTKGKWPTPIRNLGKKSNARRSSGVTRR